MKEDLKKIQKIKKITDFKKKVLEDLKKVKNMEEDLGLIMDEDIDNENKNEIKENQETQENDTELQKFLASYKDSGSKIVVYKFNEEYQDWYKIGTYDLAGFDEDKIAKMYGGGSYRFDIKDKEGKYVKRITENFDKTAYPEPNKNMYNFLPINSQSPLNDYMKDLILEMRQMSKENQEQMLLLLNSFTQTFGQMMAAMMGHKVNLIQNASDLLTLKQLFKDNENNVNAIESVENLLDMLRTGLSLGTQLALASQPAESGSIIETALSKLLKLLPDETSKVNQSFEAIKKRLVMQQNPKQIENQSKPIENPKEVSMAQQNMLITMAKLNINPAKIAKTFIESVDDFTFNLIMNLQDSPDEIKKIIFDFVPDLSKYPEWTNKLIEEVINQAKKLSEEHKEVKDENN
jgi:hypothetical protein